MLKIIVVLISFAFLCLGLLVLSLFNKYHFVIGDDESCDKKKTAIITVCFIVATVLTCLLPMGFSPIWNGEIPEWRNQYEELTDAIIEGHVYLNDPVDPKLLSMENPYDFNSRIENGVSVAWDHAFYKGHYYMYFGIVPVLTVFLPYRLITGITLKTYQATQLFSALIIIGVFLLFRLLIKVYIKKMPLNLYILLSVFVSIISISNAIAAPALYCTAIVSAVCFGIYSFYFFLKAVYDSKTQNQAIGFAAIGSLLGALVFGCRPPIGLSNIAVIPLLFVFLKKNKIDKKSGIKLVLAALPYLLVAMGLMYYNWIRFENPFEFGQSYQLTVTDQTGYSGGTVLRSSLSSILNYFYFLFLNVSIGGLLNIADIGLLISCPVLLLLIYILLKKEYRNSIRKEAVPFLTGLAISFIAIIIADSLWSPYPVARYRLDVCWLLGIMLFIMMGSVTADQTKKTFAGVCRMLLLISTYGMMSLIAFPHEQNFTSWYMRDIKKVLFRLFPFLKWD